MDKSSHGRHIASILLGNCIAVAPELVESGFFGIVAPPYYEIKAGKDRGKSVYIRDQSDFVQWCTEFNYSTAFGIDIATVFKPTEYKRLTLEEYKPFAELVHKVGLIIDNLASEMAISPYLVEALARCSYYLTPRTMDVDAVRDMLGAERVVFDEKNQTLVIITGHSDIVLPLHMVSQRLYEKLMPLLRQSRWTDWLISVTTLKTKLYNKHLCSLYFIYQLFRKLDESLDVEVVKGLGSMDPKDMVKSCMNPRNRRVFHITSLGSLETIFNLLGSESEYRKRLRDQDVV